MLNLKRLILWVVSLNQFVLPDPPQDTVLYPEQVLKDRVESNDGQYGRIGKLETHIQEPAGMDQDQEKHRYQDRIDRMAPVAY